MKRASRTTALVGAVLLTMLGGGGAASAGTCETGCQTKHTQCTRGGADYGVCMNAWRQCKTSCVTPVRSSGPPQGARAPTPAVARR